MIEIVKISAAEWNRISEETMEYSFGEKGWDEDMNRVSYAILAQDDSAGTPYGFATIVELDKKTAYIQHGGTFPTTKGTALGGRGFLHIIEHLRNRYQHIQMRVKNTNFSMLKLCIKAGFVVCGIQQDKFGKMYLVQDLMVTNG